MTTSAGPASPLGFLQLCADRRFHRRTMDAFEEAASLGSSDLYWIEASAGGAAGFDDVTVTARFAHDNGARKMGWAAHGTGCGGFPGSSDDEVKGALKAQTAKRVEEFPDAEHWFIFATEDGIEVSKLTD